MASNKTNRVEVPEAKAAMDSFKTEDAYELVVNLKE
ncbi:MAG: alpha/beta-type small acid-soluble spore protein, partial [Lachnospiraceae bacterium]|nr:alpha/beta-type small acid-soluble spore protein [Lachnospiraceae bacterium]